MVVNKICMMDEFVKCNRKYFDNTLPMPTFEIEHTFNTCADFTYTYFPSTKDVENPIIRFTDYYEFTNEQFEDLMCHEMIHYYLAYNGIDMKMKHGKEFMSMAESLNEKYKLNITKELDKATLKLSKNAPKWKNWLSNLF